jgi:general secretion pathway protein H
VCRCPASTRGFTLIEILVVLAIVGVLALAVSIGIATAGGERSLSREAERFQSLVAYACTRAELTGREIGLRFEDRGYTFSRLGFDGWVDEADEGELRARQWPLSMRAELRRDGREVQWDQRAREQPHIVCFSSGELSPFVLRLSIGDVEMRYDVQGHSDGRVTLERVAVSP